MDKRFLKECIKSEIYDSYKIWCRYFCPESNLVFSIHKYLYYAKNKGIFITNAEIENANFRKQQEKSKFKIWRWCYNVCGMIGGAVNVAML